MMGPASHPLRRYGVGRIQATTVHAVWTCRLPRGPRNLRFLALASPFPCTPLSL